MSNLSASVWETSDSASPVPCVSTPVGLSLTSESMTVPSADTEMTAPLAERSHFTQCSESREKGQWPPPISVNDGELVLDDTWIVAGLNRHNSLDDFLVLALVLVLQRL